MKILFTSTSYPPAIGGAQLHTHRVAVELVRRHHVEVITQWSEHRTDWLLGTTLAAPGVPRDYRIDGVGVHQLGLRRRDKLSLVPYVLTYYLLQERAIAKIAGRLLDQIAARGSEPDLVHNGRIGREAISFASLALARRLGVPFFLTPFHHPRWGGWMHRHYLRLYRSADGLVALTRAEKDVLIGLGVREERIHVAGMGPILAPTADGDRFLTRHGITGPVVLFLGQKYKYKNAATLLEAAPAVWRDQPETCFVFLGPRTRYSRRLFRGVRDRRIIELDAVDLQEKTDALAACTLLCLPSSQESFGGVFVEAWMMAKPVIGARIPAVAEVLSDGEDGVLTDPTGRGVAAAILAILGDRPAALAMGRAGKAKAEARFTWDRIAATIDAAYTAAIAGR